MPNLGIVMPDMGTLLNSLHQEPASFEGLGSVLFTNTRQRVLACLFGQPERSYLANELINLTGVGSGVVQRELKRLSESGLVTSEMRGINTTSYTEADVRQWLWDGNAFLKRILEQPKIWIIGNESDIPT